MLTARQPGKSMWIGEVPLLPQLLELLPNQREEEPRSGYSTHLSETKGFLSRSPAWNGPSAGEWAWGKAVLKLAVHL